MFFYTVILYTHTLYKLSGETMLATNTVSIQTNNIINFNSSHREKGWQYLLADSLAFQKEHVQQHGHAIRIQKPEEKHLPDWIKKLIRSGQCEAIFVENLRLSEEEHLAIKTLCTQFSVSLVGLTINDANNDNVVHGPW